MSTGAILALIAIIIELTVGVYVLTRNPDSRVNRTFFLLVLMVILLGIGNLITSSADHEWVARLGEQIATAGRFLTAAVFLQFTFLITRRERLLKEWWIFAMLYLPAAIFIPLSVFSDSVIGSFSLRGSTFVPNGGPLLRLSQSLVGLYLIAGVVLLVLFWYREPVEVEKERAGFVVVAILVSVSGGFTTAILLPQYALATEIVGFVVGVLTVSIVAYAVSSRGLMSTLLRTMGGEIISMMKDPVLILNSVGRIEVVNGATEELTGYDGERLKGSTLRKLFPRDSDRENASEITSGRGTSISRECVTEDGSVLPVKLTSSPVRTRSGKKLGMVVVLHDMREAYELARAQERAGVAARDAALQKSYAEELAGIIDIAAHELRHPAAVFKGYAITLLENWKSLDDGELQDALQSIDRAADRLKRLSIDLLDTSNIQSGGVTLDYGEELPGDIIGRVVDEMRARGFSNEFRRREVVDAVPLKADTEKLETVLSILLDNAVKFSPPGSRIDVWFEQDDRGTVFRVADRGRGIAEEHREQVFGKFFQVEDAQHHSIPGLGLGLYLASRIVEAHGGWIRAETREGKGTVFSFGIPGDST